MESIEDLKVFAQPSTPFIRPTTTITNCTGPNTPINETNFVTLNIPGGSSSISPNLQYLRRHTQHSQQSCHSSSRDLAPNQNQNQVGSCLVRFRKGFAKFFGKIMGSNTPSEADKYEYYDYF